MEEEKEWVLLCCVIGGDSRKIIDHGLGVEFLAHGWEEGR